MNFIFYIFREESRLFPDKLSDFLVVHKFPEILEYTSFKKADCWGGGKVAPALRQSIAHL